MTLTTTDPTPADVEYNSWTDNILAARRGPPIKHVPLAQLILETPALGPLFVNKALFSALLGHKDREGKAAIPSEKKLYCYASTSTTDRALLDALAHSVNHMVVDESRSQVNMPHKAFQKGSTSGFNGFRILQDALEASLAAVNEKESPKLKPEVIETALWDWRKTVEKHMKTYMNAGMYIGH